MSALSLEILPEHDLIEATRDGDHRAFEELYARYQERISAFIHSRVRDHGRAEDVAQEVFISALRRLRASSQEIAFKPWIYEIAKNACIDEYRRSLRGREVPLDDGDGPPAARLLSTAPTPPAAVEAKERLSDLRGAFGVLSETHHQLLVMREFEGLSYDEIGARTGMSRQMIESALFRARRKLTEEYEELASGRRCEQIQTAVQDGRAMSAANLGLRERRRFARHLAHCQSCRMHAQLAGVDETLLVTRTGLGAKIAALLPFPLLRWPWAGRHARAAVAEVGAHPDTLATLHRASEPAAATSLGGAAVAAAVLALAGTGAVVAPDASRGQVLPPSHAVAAPAPPAVQATRSSTSGPAAPAPPPVRALRAHLQALGAAQKAGRAAASTGHRAARRHETPGAGAPGSAAAPTVPTAGTGSGAASASGASVAGADTHRRGLPVRSTSPGSPGTVVRSTGGGLAGAISSTTGLTTRVTAGLPISSAASSLGGTLATGTLSSTDALGSSADATTGTASGAVDGAQGAATGVLSAAGAATGEASSEAAATLDGASGSLRSIVHGLTGH